MKKKQLEHGEDYSQRDHKTKNDSVEAPKEQNEQSIKTLLVLELQTSSASLERKKINE